MSYRLVLANWTVLAQEEVSISTCRNSGVITFCFNCKTQWQMFLLLYGRQSSVNIFPDNARMKNCRCLISWRSCLSINRLSCPRFLTLFIKWLRFLVLIAWIRSNNDSINFAQKMRKKWHSTLSTLNRKSSSCRESLGKYLSLYMYTVFPGYYKDL